MGELAGQSDAAAPRIMVVLPSTPLLDAVVALADENKATLGLFPRGAFEDHAGRKNIVAAVAENGDLQGYLMFRVVRRSETAVITHLCVAPDLRGRGIAEALVNHLKRETKNLVGIRLRCRKDYKENRVWPKFGFSAIREVPGGGKEPKPLTEWWFDHGRPNLFTDLERRPPVPDTIRVVIDTNVYLDLVEEGRPDGAFTRALLEDWVGAVAEIEWLSTPELDSELAKRGSLRREGYPLVEPDAAKFGQILPIVIQILDGGGDGTSLSSRSMSDARHLAQAVAAGETCFLTRDEEVIEKAGDLREKFNLDVLHPLDLVQRLDRIHDEQRYVPALLRDRQLRMVRVSPTEVDEVAATFPVQGERKSEFIRRARTHLADPRCCELLAVVDGQERLALLALERRGDRALDIAMLRIAVRGGIAETLRRHLVWSVVEQAAKERRAVVEYRDAVSDGRFLVECDFAQRDNRWIRIQAVGEYRPASLAAWLRELSTEPSTPASASATALTLAEQLAIGGPEPAAARIERALWPAFLVESGIASCMVPIKGIWAKELFDHELAKGYLYVPSTHLMLNTENVYYSAARPPAELREGCRILWYVASDAHALRAMSICDEVVIDEARVLFKQFQHLGVYTWKQVGAMTEGRRSTKLTAIRFSHTRLLDREVPLDALRVAYRKRTGKQLPLQFPLAIDESIVLNWLSLSRGSDVRRPDLDPPAVREPDPR